MNSIRSYLALLCAVSLSLGATGDADYRKIQFAALVVDTHNDVAQRILAV